MLLSINDRISHLGRVGEEIAAACLLQNGFTEVIDLNTVRRNYPFADVMAVKDGVRFFIGVKTRNEMKQGRSALNESYNLILANNARNRILKEQGLSVDQITSMLLDEVWTLARKVEAVPAWITIPVNVTTSTYSAYFGLLEDLGHKRSVPMTMAARARYLALSENTFDPRLTPALLNS